MELKSISQRQLPCLAARPDISQGRPYLIDCGHVSRSVALIRGSWAKLSRIHLPKNFQKIREPFFGSSVCVVREPVGSRLRIEFAENGSTAMSLAGTWRRIDVLAFTCSC